MNVSWDGVPLHRYRDFCCRRRWWRRQRGLSGPEGLAEGGGDAIRVKRRELTGESNGSGIHLCNHGDIERLPWRHAGDGADGLQASRADWRASSLVRDCRNQERSIRSGENVIDGDVVDGKQ